MLPVVSTMNMTSANAVVGEPAEITPSLSVMSVTPPTPMVAEKLSGVSESAFAGAPSSTAAAATEVKSPLFARDSRLPMDHPLYSLFHTVVSARQ